MSVVFADTGFWIALVNPRDQHHERAKAAEAKHSQDTLLTTEAVVIEFFNFYSSLGSFWRKKSHEYYDAMRQSKQVRILEQTTDILRQAIDLHRSRLDKGYSLTDCLSMTVMRDYDCQEVLTNDQHFEQEGFTILM